MNRLIHPTPETTEFKQNIFFLAVNVGEWTTGTFKECVFHGCCATSRLQAACVAIIDHHVLHTVQLHSLW